MTNFDIDSYIEDVSDDAESIVLNTVADTVADMNNYCASYLLL